MGLGPSIDGAGAGGCGCGWGCGWGCGCSCGCGQVKRLGPRGRRAPAAPPLSPRRLGPWPRRAPAACAPCGHRNAGIGRRGGAGGATPWPVASPVAVASVSASVLPRRSAWRTRATKVAATASNCITLSGARRSLQRRVKACGGDASSAEGRAEPCGGAPGGSAPLCDETLEELDEEIAVSRQQLGVAARRAVREKAALEQPVLEERLEPRRRVDRGERERQRSQLGSPRGAGRIRPCFDQDGAQRRPVRDQVEQLAQGEPAAAPQVGRGVVPLEAEACPLLGVPRVRQLWLERRPELAQPGVDRLGRLVEGALLLECGAERALPAEEVERELHVGLRRCSPLWADACEHLGGAGLG
eukprot:scaffold4414_cov65-Phaeocystis_antarctica.AAC.4